MIELSVALPVWNSKRIAWLCMESLCRQEKIDFEWEVVIAEENLGEFCGKAFFRSYEERLKKIGCYQIKYIKLVKWIPLAAKWKLIAKNTDVNSKAFLLQAVDCYSEPMRLFNTNKYVKEGFDWVQNKIGMFFNIRTHKCIMYDDSTMIQRAGLNMATLTNYMRNIEDSNRRASVDGWIHKNVRPKNKKNLFGEECLKGVDSHGLNNISVKRERFFENVEFPFKETNLTLKDVVPTDIAIKLMNLRNN